MSVVNAMNVRALRPIRFHDYLPEVFRGNDTTPPSFQSRFLNVFEDVFEELQSLIEGVPGGDLRLRVCGLSIRVKTPHFPQGSQVTRAHQERSARLSQGLPADLDGLDGIEVDDAEFARSLTRGEKLGVHEAGGATLTLVVASVSDRRIEIERFVAFAAASAVSRPGRPEPGARLIRSLPTNLSEITQIEIDDPQFVAKYSIEDPIQIAQDTGIVLTLIVRAFDEIIVDPRDLIQQTFPSETFVSIDNHPNADTTTLVEEFPAKVGDDIDLTHMRVRDADFVAELEPDSELVLHAGGVPDLFHPSLTPPPQFAIAQKDRHPEPDSAFLNFLASWIGFSLRDDLIPRTGEADRDGLAIPNDPQYTRRKARWNRNLLRTAVGIYPRRGTLIGVEEMLRAWLKDDLVENGVIVTDLLRHHTDVDTIFQLGERARVGVDTVLGEGPPFFFIADLKADPAVPGLRNPAGIDLLLREARFILETETPAHAYYQLRVHATTMQLAPPLGDDPASETDAQIGKTTQLWDEPAVFPAPGERSDVAFAGHSQRFPA